MTRPDADALLSAASAAAAAATTPEAVVHDTMAPLFAALGDRAAHLVPGALDPGQQQFFVGGAFLATPDGVRQMLVGNQGFPPEQRRLMIPIDGGDPGRVIASARPLLLRDTRGHAGFRQYLKTARMGSAIYAPLLEGGRAFGLVILAAQAGGTFGEGDLAVLVAAAPVVSAHWQRTGGPRWLAAEYARALESGEAFIAG
jgi:hypothetical protein